MRVLITGGCGFVGRHFVERFMRDQYTVDIVDDFSTGKYPLATEILFYNKFYEKDIRVWIKDCVPNYDLVIHCAAIVGGRLTIEGDPLKVATDLSIDAEFFNWLAKHKFKGKVVYFSSSAVYPSYLQTQRVPLKETVCNHFMAKIGVPDFTYGWAKLTGELLARYAVVCYGLDVVVYRPFSGYGSDQDKSYPFPAILERIVRGADPIVVWGSGDQCRDFIHIDDIVEAVLATMNVLSPGDALNLGTGRPVSFRQLATLMYVGNYEGIRMPNPNIVNDPSKPEGVFYRVADVTKLHRFYKPKVTLEEGIQRAIEEMK